MFIVAAEVLPHRLRAFGLGTTAAVYWAMCFLANQTLETLLEASRPGTFALLALLGCISLTFVVVCIPRDA